MDLGNSVVTDQLFSLELDFDIMEGRKYVIRHIVFVPEEKGSDPVSTSSIDEEEMRHKTERLKSLGYVQ